MNRITAILLPPLLLLPSLARAEEEKSNLPHVFLVPFQVLGAAGSDLVTGKLTEQLETDLEGRTGKLMLLTEPAAPTFVDEGSSLNAETSGLQSMLLPARRHYRIGMGLLQIERFEEAMTELNEAIRLYEGNLAFLKPDDFNELLQAFVQLSVAAMRAGYEDEAEEAISQVVRMSSDFNPAGKGLPPIYQKIVGRHRRKIDKLGAGTMEIVTNPPTAKVFVDGKEQGETPLTLKKIGAGMHFVQLARPLAGVWAEKIEFPGRNKKDKKVIDLPPIGGEASLAESKEQADAAARAGLEAVLPILRTGLADATLKRHTVELALHTGADYVVMGYVSTLPTGYRLRPLILRTDGFALADLGRIQFDFELLGSVMQMKELGDLIVAAQRSFPETLVPDKAPQAMVAAAQLVAAAAQAAPEVVAGGLPPGDPSQMWAAGRPPQRPSFGDQQPMSPADVPPMPLEALATGRASVTMATSAAPFPPAAAQPPVTPPPPPAAPPGAVVPPPLAPPPVGASGPLTPPPAAVKPAAPPAAAASQPVAFPPPLAPPPPAHVVTATTVRPQAVPAAPPPPPTVAAVLGARPQTAPAAPVPQPTVATAATTALRPQTMPAATPPQPAAPGQSRAPYHYPQATVQPPHPTSATVIPRAPAEPPWQPASTGPPPSPPPVGGEGEHQKWYERWWVWGSAAAVIGGGATAAVLLFGEEASPQPAKGVVPMVVIRQ